MITNIQVAERHRQPAVPGHRECRSTTSLIGRGVAVDGVRAQAGDPARLRTCDARIPAALVGRASDHPPQRAHLLRRRGAGHPPRLRRAAETCCEIEMVPKGSGSENNSFLKMAIPAEGVDAIKTFVVDCVIAAGGKTCPPTIVGVGRRRHFRPVRGTRQARGDPRARQPLRRSGRCSARSGAERPRSTSSASARRASAATRPRSRCTSNSPRRTSP